MQSLSARLRKLRNVVLSLETDQTVYLKALVFNVRCLFNRLTSATAIDQSSLMQSGSIIVARDSPSCAVKQS